MNSDIPEGDKYNFSNFTGEQKNNFMLHNIAFLYVRTANSTLKFFFSKLIAFWDIIYFILIFHLKSELSLSYSTQHTNF